MLKQNDTVLVLVDVQERLTGVMHQSEELLAQLEKLIKGVQLLDIPIIWLEQYPRGLGATDASLRALLEPQKPIEKMTFGACKSEVFETALKAHGRSSIVVAGIESHICVYQTVAELVEDFYVEVIHDCVSSRTLENKELGVDKMVALGAGVTSLETLLFELLETAEHPKFKEISRLIK